MIRFENIRPSQYTYELPDVRIAKYPVGRRDQSRLLVLDTEGRLREDFFKNVALFLPAGSRLYINNSRVIPARLIFPTRTGTKVEIFCLNPLNPQDYSEAFSSTRSCSWQCMIGNAKRFKERILQQNVTTQKGTLTFSAEKSVIKGNTAEILFSWNDSGLSFAEIISAAGQTPLPPYIRRDPEPDDRQRYQTIYSKTEGSVAAPTAGLHFTDEVLKSLADNQISKHEITLHVGAGTFQPVKAEFVKDHKMHAEYFEVSRGMVEELARHSNGITCVGTTTVRTLESLYWIGARLAMTSEMPAILHLDQWEPYSLEECPLDQAFNALAGWFESHRTERVLASTSLMIVPGYRFKLTERLITNFHQPGSSLLMLIAAFIGEQWKEIYNHALNEGFRFLSYGDSSLLFRPARV